MKNLKFYIFCILATLLTMTESSFANNEGYFIDASISRNEVNHKNININSLTIGQTITPIYQFNDQKDTNAGFSIKVGKKFNIADTALFLSPAIAYDNLNNSVKDNNNFEYQIKNRIITDISAGIDLTKNSSIYISYGISDVGYEVDASNVNTNYESNYPTGFGGLTNPETRNFGTYKNRNSSEILGFGYKLRTGKDLFLLLEYSQQRINLHSNHRALLTGGRTTVETNTRIESLKIGISKSL